MKNRMDIIEELRWRGSIYDITPGAEELLEREKISVYVGFDPSASSLHVGNMVPIMGLVHAQRAGHTPIALVGGGTGLIGDPSGKTSERQLLTKDVAAANAESIRDQLEHFLDFEVESNAARMRNNNDWLQNSCFAQSSVVPVFNSQYSNVTQSLFSC